VLDAEVRLDVSNVLGVPRTGQGRQIRCGINTRCTDEVSTAPCDASNSSSYQLVLPMGLVLSTSSTHCM